MAGRPHKKITKNDLYNYLYIYEKVLWCEHRYKCEDKLFEVLINIDIKNMNRSNFEEFINTHLDLINKLEYKLNERRKNNEIIKYLKNITQQKLSTTENQILNLEENWFALTRDEYFELQKLLNNYRSKNISQIKNRVSQNIQSSEDKAIEQEKFNARKNLNHEKFFLGGAFLSVYKELFNNENIHPTNALIDMIKVYAIYQFNAQHNSALPKVFEQYRHLQAFADLENKLTEISLDPRNPANKKVN